MAQKQPLYDDDGNPLTVYDDNGNPIASAPPKTPSGLTDVSKQTTTPATSDPSWWTKSVFGETEPTIEEWSDPNRNKGTRLMERSYFSQATTPLALLGEAAAAGLTAYGGYRAYRGLKGAWENARIPSTGNTTGTAQGVSGGFDPNAYTQGINWPKPPVTPGGAAGTTSRTIAGAEPGTTGAVEKFADDVLGGLSTNPATRSVTQDVGKIRVKPRNIGNPANEKWLQDNGYILEVTDERGQVWAKPTQNPTAPTTANTGAFASQVMGTLETNLPRVLTKTVIRPNADQKARMQRDGWVYTKTEGGKQIWTKSSDPAAGTTVPVANAAADRFGAGPSRSVGRPIGPTDMNISAPNAQETEDLLKNGWTIGKPDASGMVAISHPGGAATTGPRALNPVEVGKFAEAVTGTPATGTTAAPAQAAFQFAPLPRDLAGAAPNYNIGPNQYTPKFASDVDKAIYIISNPKTKSKREDDYIKYIISQIGGTEAEVRALGARVRDHLKRAAKGQPAGELTIPSVIKPNPKGPPPPPGSVPPSQPPPPATPQGLPTTPAVKGTPSGFGGRAAQWNVTENPDGTYTDLAYGTIFNPKDQTAVVVNTTKEAVADLRAKGFESTEELVQHGQHKGRPIMVQSALIEDPLVEKATTWEKILNVTNIPKSAMSVDLPFTTSAAFRQGAPLVGTKNWFRSWASAAKAYRSNEIYDGIMDKISKTPYFQRGKETVFQNGHWIRKETPSYAEKMGVRMTDMGVINQREESIMSNLVEKIPGYGRHVAGSNRAYSGFLNNLRSETFTDLINAYKAGNGGQIPDDIARNIAQFVNDATGRGTLRFKLAISPKHQTDKVSLEFAAKALNFGFFSPRNMASKISLLNPMTYAAADNFTRKQYMAGLARQMGVWWTIAALAELSGEATVEKDSRSSDYAKVHWKGTNTRMDPGAGLQQFMVYYSRIKPDLGLIPNADDRELRQSSRRGPDMPFLGTYMDLAKGSPPFVPGWSWKTTAPGQRATGFGGEGYKTETGWDASVKFWSNKANPPVKLAIDTFMMSKDRPVFLLNRLVEMGVPMLAADTISGDMWELMKENPAAFGITAGYSAIGGASQTYESENPKPPFFPEPKWSTFTGKGSKTR